MRTIETAKAIAARNALVFGKPFMVCQHARGHYGVASLAADIPHGWTFVCSVA